MRISDWSSDVCSSDLSSPGIDRPLTMARQYRKNIGRSVQVSMQDNVTKTGKLLEVADNAITIIATIKEKGKKAVEQQQTIPLETKIGRASCRERVCQYV